MREKILTFIEKNSRIDLKELAVVLGVEEAAVMNELEAILALINEKCTNMWLSYLD